jgi:hypothetical protein
MSSNHLQTHKEHILKAENSTKYEHKLHTNSLGKIKLRKIFLKLQRNIISQANECLQYIMERVITHTKQIYLR